MDREELKVRERSRDVSALRLAAQQRVVHEHARLLNAAQLRKSKAGSELQSLRRALGDGRAPIAFHDLLARNVARSEIALAAVQAEVADIQSRLESELQSKKRFEAICLHLGEVVSKADAQIEEQSAETEIEERVAVLASEGSPVACDPGTVGTSTFDTVSNGSSKPLEVFDGTRGNPQRFQQQNSSPHTDGERSTRSTVRDLQHEWNEKGVSVSRFDSWKRLDDRGMRLEARLANGTPVTLAISVVAGDALSVRLSKNSISGSTSIHSAREQISAALKAKGLKVKDVTVVEEL